MAKFESPKTNKRDEKVVLIGQIIDGKYSHLICIKLPEYVLVSDIVREYAEWGGWEINKLSWGVSDVLERVE